jgi:hypothetical protein
MAGAQPSGPTPSTASPESQKQQQLQSAVMQIRQLEQGITSIAKQFPEASTEARQAVESVRALIRRIVSSPGQTEPAAPDIL